MITGNLPKLGLTGCDIQEVDSNKNCKVVIDVNSRRLVELQSDDEVGAFKQLATAEFLQNHLSTIHRRELYFRVIKMKSIELQDLKQLIICIDDPAEELIDRWLEIDKIEHGLGDLISKKLKGQSILQVIEEIDDDFNLAQMYILIKATDKKLAKDILPIVKAVTHQCMVLSDDFPHCNLEERYLRCLELLTEAPLAQCDLRTKADCVAELNSLRKVWFDPELVPEWDQIKQFPKVPVGHQKERLKTLRRAEVLVEGIGRNREEIKDIQEEIKKGKKTEQERIVKIQEVSELLNQLRQLRESIGDAGPLSVAGSYASQSEAETLRPISLERSLPPPYRTPPDYHSLPQAAHKKDRTQITQAPSQHGATSELLGEAALLTVPASASSTTGDSAPDKTKGAIPKKPKKEQSRLVRPATSVQHIEKITDRTSFIKRLVEKCEMEHDKCIAREYDLQEFIGDPTEENKEKALKAISEGFWRAKFIDVRLTMAALKLVGHAADNSFSQKHSQLLRENAFKYGLSPLDFTSGNRPYFIRQTDESNNTSFTLNEGCSPSEAIKACRNQLFIADYYCFFQTIVYELILEALGEKIFDWYYSGESRLRLTPVGVPEALRLSNPVSKILVGTQAEGGKDKLGLIKTLRPDNYKRDDAYINKFDILHAICTNATKKLYTVPGVRKSESLDELASTIAFLMGTGHSERGQRVTLMHELTYRCEWNEVMKIKTAYMKYEGAKRDSQEHEPVRKERERRRPRQKKEEGAGASLVTAGTSQQLSSLTPQVSAVAQHYEEPKKEFELYIGKAYDAVVKSTRAYKKKRTDEIKQRLQDDILQLEQKTENLQITSEIDEDTRQRLVKRKDAALKAAREALK